MPIDPRGTQPGLASNEPVKEQTFNIRCRNEKCDSITARDVTPATVTHAKRYQCTKCGFTWGVQTGGAFMVF